jgi:hypothetical protein
MANVVGEILTVIERAFWIDSPFESCNLNTVGVVPTAVALPTIFPVDGSNVSPLGNTGDPGTILHV